MTTPSIPAPRIRRVVERARPRLGVLGAARIVPKALLVPAGDLVDVCAVAARDLGRARIFAQEHRIEGAHGSYQELLARSDIDASHEAYAASRYAEALEPTERLTRRFPGQAIYFERLARIQQALGRPAEEARAWEAVFRTSPTPVDACPMIASAYERLSDGARALDAYERCAEVEPDNPDLLLTLGRAYSAAGRSAEARKRRMWRS